MCSSGTWSGHRRLLRSSRPGQMKSRLCRHHPHLYDGTKAGQPLNLLVAPAYACTCTRRLKRACNVMYMYVSSHRDPLIGSTMACFSRRNLLFVRMSPRNLDSGSSVLTIACDGLQWPLMAYKNIKSRRHTGGRGQSAGYARE